jgi:hypothetical protein
MNMSKLIAVAVLLSVAGCQATHRTVFGPNDTSEGHGDIVPINYLLPANVTRVRLVFVHGVGDHCPGYALPVTDKNGKTLPTNPWLDQGAQDLIGLKPRNDIPDIEGNVNASVFMHAPSHADEPSVHYRVRHYYWKPTESDAMWKQRELDAIEITWSPLTQAIKSNWLGYDSPSAFANEAEGGCVITPINPTVPKTVNPLPRTRVNKLLKETVFDRDLADAVIYAGTYGSAIAHGVAEGLCHAISSTPDTSSCRWPDKISADEENTAYIFVTHSLGSRIIFDFYRDLAADEKAEYRPNLFDLDERRSANLFVSSMLERTSAIYMMANQLPMLGLARIKSASLVANPVGPLGDTAGTATQQDISGLAELEKIHHELLKKKKTVIPSIQITAFHDTNDLLTWPLPSWYASSSLEGPVNFTNVFVDNARWHWLGVFEHPGDAHSGYFHNHQVWCVIGRGALNGSPNPCPY